MLFVSALIDIDVRWESDLPAWGRWHVYLIFIVIFILIIVVLVLIP